MLHFQLSIFDFFMLYYSKDMKKIKISMFLPKYFIAGILAGGVIAVFFGRQAINDLRITDSTTTTPGGTPPQALPGHPDSKFGNWLAAQHAIYVDDFEKAVGFMAPLENVKYSAVDSARNLVVFLESGKAPNIAGLKKGNAIVYKIVNATELAKQNKWKQIQKDFKNEKSLNLAPFRIWAAAASGKPSSAVRIIDEYKIGSNGWRDFTKGAVYAATKNPKTAKKYFEKVSPSFLNLGDYHLVMSFYKKFGFDDAARNLRKQWVSSPGGMYMAGLDLGENWGDYDSLQKMLAAGLVQAVSHDGANGYSDIGLLSLRAAFALNGPKDSINYYTGGYFYNAGSDNCKKYWDKLDNNPIYEPFIRMKNVEKADNLRQSIRELDRILKRNPLFMPAIMKSWRQNMQNGRDYDAMRTINRALRHRDLPEDGRAYLLRLRAHVFLLTEEFDNAESDLEIAAKIVPMDAGIMGLQARVWAAQNKNLDEAYRYAISLVKAFPSSVEYWDVLAMVIWAKEGWQAALEILERVGRVAETTSSLFMHLGDLRLRAGFNIGAAQAYRKAIALSDDGLVIREEVEHKLEKMQ